MDHPAQLDDTVAAGRGEPLEALEGLSWAAWWLEDVPACLATRASAHAVAEG